MNSRNGIDGAICQPFEMDDSAMCLRMLSIGRVLGWLKDWSIWLARFIRTPISRTQHPSANDANESSSQYPSGRYACAIDRVVAYVPSSSR